MDGQTVSGAASLLCSCRRCFRLKLSDSKADLVAKKVNWWRQNEDNLPLWAGAVKMVLLIQPSLRLLGEFSPYSEPFRSAAGCIQDYVETSMIIGFATLIVETITLMCLSLQHKLIIS